MWAEVKGFEPLRRFTDLMVFKTTLFNQLEYTSEIKKFPTSVIEQLTKRLEN